MKYIFGFLLGCMVCAIITIYSRPTALDLPEEVGEAVAGDTMYYTIQDGTMFIRYNCGNDPSFRLLNVVE